VRLLSDSGGCGVERSGGGVAWSGAGLDELSGASGRCGCGGSRRRLSKHVRRMLRCVAVVLLLSIIFTT
jgi:hypothetical protein